MMLMLIVIAIVYPVAATCPPHAWVNGITPDGRYECLLTVGDNDDPPVEITTGKLHCTPGTSPRVIDAHHVRCVTPNRYKD